MAEKDKETVNNETGNPVLDVIDPIYKKFAKSVIRSLGSFEFYEYFMSSIAHGENEIQFSNKRMEKYVDNNWVDKIEETLDAFQNIIATPRNVIREDELIVDIAYAKKTGSDSVRHLATHTSLVEAYDPETGDVRPNKIMQKYREDSIGQVYENRVVFTSLEMAYQFVKIRHDALFEAMGDEFGAKLKVKSDVSSSIENIHMDMYMSICDKDGILETDEKNREIFDRISRLFRVLSVAMSSHFARHMSRYPRIKGAITKTNVLKKNKNYRLATELMEYLRSYDSIGYTIKIIEQNPIIDEAFEKDIYHNILFNYLVLKNHLERDKDRMLPAPMKEKKRSIKPKFIKQIIEELTEDYDLPDIEIRKVLIEELTKEQLMKEEEAERLRLVEEQERRKKEEEERIRLEKEAEKERIRLEKEAEKERIRIEKEAEKKRLLLERMELEQEDRRRTSLFKKDIEYFLKNFEDQVEARKEFIEQQELAKQDFEDAVLVLEEADRLKSEAAKRERERRRMEREQERRQRELEELQAQREYEAEQERIRQEQLLKEESERQAQYERDIIALSAYIDILKSFDENLDSRLEMRVNEKKRIQREKEERENAQRARQLSRMSQK